MIKFNVYQKFANFNGCTLTMMLPYTQASFLNSYHWGYAKTDSNTSTEFTIHGITPAIFKIAGKKYNFKDDYAPTAVYEKDWILNFDLQKVVPVGFNKTFKQPNVYFDITGVHYQNIYKNRMSNVFAELKYKILVTPADAYTSYEKLMLPFDLPTWILLLFTFGVTFGTILIINKLQKTARNFVYGKKVDTPALNVVKIFFGIAQVKLPTENFSRIILILFIYFCLVFRTCFQSKSFEFLTSEPRRPPPITLKDLVAQNYTIYTLYKKSIEIITDGERNNW